MRGTKLKLVSNGEQPWDLATVLQKDYFKVLLKISTRSPCLSFGDAVFSCVEAFNKEDLIDSNRCLKT